MKFKSSIFTIILSAVVLTGSKVAFSVQDVNVPPTWPRIFEKDGNTVIIYQPQVDAWKDYSKIRFRAAIAVSEQNSVKPDYGVLAVQADTLVDHDARMVLMTNLDSAIRFPGLSDERSEELKRIARGCIPHKEFLNVSLDHVVAYMNKAPVSPPVNLNLNPPPIFYSDVPAILVIYLGQPQFKPVAGTKLMFAVNTNWVIFMDTNTSQYYLLNGDSWLTSSDPLKGVWTAAEQLPNDLSMLSSGGSWDEISKHVPGKAAVKIPLVLISTEPAELILTNGPPEYTPISGTRLMYVSNPEMPLFLDLIDGNYYYLVSGRWFSSANLSGPWTNASANLPAEFAKIPVESPVGYVLTAIPGTQEAKDAVLMASIPHKATVNISDANVNVTYDGPPKFEPIQGTSMTYAVNTSYEVVYANSQYYCCYQGVWFTSSAAKGPWTVCASVPNIIYTIPPSNPLYNTTYVQVYSSTPNTVSVGYTGGYSGEYVASTGVLMFGAGMATAALLASSNYWYDCSPCYYSYGCAATYSYAYGGYYRGGTQYYGPYGGAGWGAAYNPATGTWARAGYAYGPAGARWGAQAYNPFTNTYAAHTGGTNGYQSWGHSVVSEDGKWAQAGHVSGAAGTAGYVQTSTGKEAAGVHTAGGSTVVKTGSGDVYAGHDGNVYKKSDGQWQKYQGNGNWGDTSWNKPTPTQYQRPSSTYQTPVSSQDRSMSTRQNSWRNDWSTNNWKNDLENSSDRALGNSGQDRWNQHDTQMGLNQDSWARDRGNYNASSSWGERSGGFGGGGWNRGGFGGGGFRGGGFRR